MEVEIKTCLRAAMFCLSLLMCTYAQSEDSEYLKSLQAEAGNMSLDQQTILQHDASMPVIDKVSDKQRLEIGSEQLMPLLKQNYPASYRVFSQMSQAQQKKVFTNYNLHKDIDRLRKEMTEILRR